MKVSLNWLKSYVKTDKSPEELSRILTDTGLEVEGLEKIEGVPGGLKGVVTGKVVTCEKHPDADKLQVTTVDVGAEELLQIVCGAPNCAAGEKVIVATVGCTLYPDPEKPFKIKKSKIRGVESHGMLCAEDELGLGTSHDGILLLPADTKVGMQGAEYFDLQDDYLIEIGLTPNRADAMGHIGVARDIVAYLNVHENAGLSLDIPDVSSFKVDNNSTVVDVKVENTDACARYMGTTISNVKVAPSPEWMQASLRAIGLSPINNIVDITNYVMHEFGTPLHAFDNAIVNGKVVVKNAKSGEKFTTLDDAERTLDELNLMITNGSDNMCIAGVFGGSKSGVSNETTSIFLESAYFNPVSVRMTAKFHGLNTDASFRFERGVDPSLTEIALKRACLLIQELAGGEIAMDVVDIYPNKIENHTVAFSYDRCNKLIGANIEKQMVNTILENLDIKILSEKEGVAQLEVPTYRVDVTREADVIEEVLRIYGFNKVEIPSKLNTSISYRSGIDAEKLQNTVSDLLVGKGFSEMMNNSLTQSKYAEELGGEVVKSVRNVEMLNPLSLELDVMRQTLLFQTLESIGYNQNRQSPDLRLFEFGKSYHKFEDGYSENRRVLIAMTGRATSENWNTGKEKVSYYTLKGEVQALFQRLGLSNLLKEKAVKTTLLADGVQLVIAKRKVGELGWISPQLKKHFGIKSDVFIADLDWDAIIDCMKMSKVKFSELPKYPEVRRDFSLLLDDKIKFQEIQEIARKADNKILKEVGLFDVYEGKNLKEGKKSYAVNFTFQDKEQTLKDKQVDAVMEKIRKGLETQLGAELR